MMKKMILLLMAALLIFSVFGCAAEGSKETENSTAPEAASEAEPSEKAEEADLMYVTVGSVNVRIGKPFADFSSGLPEEVLPTETLTPCGDDNGWRRIMHFYAGITITEDENGDVFEISISNENGEGEATAAGQIKLGNSMDDVRAVMGTETVQEDEYFLTYKVGEVCAQFGCFDGKSGVLDSITFFRAADRGY